MKFEYDKPETEARECVAYIDVDGDLIIPDGEGRGVYVYSDGSGADTMDWEPINAIHKFYRGDSVTITF